MHFRKEGNETKEPWQGIKAHVFQRLKKESHSIDIVAGKN